MWIARNKNGTLWLFLDKPIKIDYSGTWQVNTKDSLLRVDDCMEIDGDLYPSLKWEDEPIEVILQRK